MYIHTNSNFKKMKCYKNKCLHHVCSYFDQLKKKANVFFSVGHKSVYKAQIMPHIQTGKKFKICKP